MIRNCNECGNKYEAEARYVNRGQGLFCSRACSGVYHGRLRTVKHEPNTTCSWCGNALYRKPSLLSRTSQSFCNAKCQKLAASNPDSGYRTGPAPTIDRAVVTNCSVCEKPSREEAHPSCRKKEKRIEDWLAGDNSVTLNHSRSTGLPTDTKAFVKKYLIETRGDKCESCGFDQKAPDGRSIIQMDHINGNCFDNSPANLKLLCPNCHAMTPTYGSLNKGSGRAHRRKSVTSI